jgi:hypothetical protein
MDYWTNYSRLGEGEIPCFVGEVGSKGQMPIISLNSASF